MITGGRHIHPRREHLCSPQTICQLFGEVPSCEPAIQLGPPAAHGGLSSCSFCIDSMGWRCFGEARFGEGRTHGNPTGLQEGTYCGPSIPFVQWPKRPCVVFLVCRFSTPLILWLRVYHCFDFYLICVMQPSLSPTSLFLCAADLLLE